MMPRKVHDNISNDSRVIVLTKTSTATLYFWLAGWLRPPQTQRVMSAGSGGRRDTLRPPPLLRLLLVLLYSKFGD